MTPHDGRFPREIRLYEFEHRLREGARILAGALLWAGSVFAMFWIGPLLACGLLGACQ